MSFLFLLKPLQVNFEEFTFQNKLKIVTVCIDNFTSNFDNL